MAAQSGGEVKHQGNPEKGNGHHGGPSLQEYGFVGKESFFEVYQ